MDDKRKTPKLRFPGFIDDWEQRKFNDVFDGLQNNTLSRAELNYESGNVKNVHYGDVLIKFGDYIDVSVAELPFITNDENIAKYSGSFLQDGDIIIADTAEDDTVGKCSEIVGSEGVKLLSGLHTIPCRPKQKYAPKYLGYYMNSDAYHKQLKPLMQGIKVTSISKGALQDTNIMMPKSYDEQAKIGIFLSNINNLSTLHQRKLEQMKEYKKGLLQKMFPKNGDTVPEIRFPGFTDAWEQRKLGEWCNFINGDRSSNYPSATEFVEDGIPFVGSDSLGSTLIDKTKLRFITSEKYEQMNGLKIEKNDILYTLRGAGFGKCSIADFSEGTVASSLVGIRCNESLHAKFLIQWLGSANAENEKNKAVNGSTAQNISVEDMKKYCISVPCMAEQDKISEYLYNLDNLITLHQRKLEQMKEYKKGLLQQMFV
jgi:type I restriction enzyme S subunit